MLERLIAAIRVGDIAAMRELLRADAPVNAVDPISHYTLLTLAVRNKNAEAVVLLLEHGADPNWTKGAASGAMMEAVGLDLPDITRNLLEHGAAVGGAILFVANVEMLDLLVAYGGDVNPPSSDTTTPLHLAVFKENCDVR